MKKRSKVVAVITGDVVGSSAVKDRAFLNMAINEAFDGIKAQKEYRMVRSFEIYRGDSFQGVLDPVHALRAALSIRARLRQWKGPVSLSAASRGKKAGKRPVPIPLGLLPDARIAIGIGTVSYRSSKVMESDGEAFKLSGHALDGLGKSTGRLALLTPWEEVNAETGASMQLLDALVNKWSSASAQAMFHYLAKGSTQSELSEILGISQPAVHKRLVAADQMAIHAALERYEQLIENNWSGDARTGSALPPADRPRYRRFPSATRRLGT